MPDELCFGHIEFYASLDVCSDCPRINDCCNQVLRGHERDTLKQYFGFSEPELDELLDGVVLGDKQAGDDAIRKVIDNARCKIAVRNRRAKLTPEEKALTAGMPGDEYTRWLDCRRARRHRANINMTPSPVAICATAPALKDELAWRWRALTAWVEPNRGSDRLARSLFKKSDQKVLIAAWLVRERLRRFSGAEPTLQAIADDLTVQVKHPVSRQTAKRLVDKITKLEASGCPWQRKV